MKKTFVILTIVLAMLAAPVFAEVTASGEVNYAWGFNADDYEENIDTNDMVINLGGTVGEYTSIAAEFEGENDLSGNVSAGGNSYAVSMNTMEITQDVTGALGIDAGVSVALTVGIEDFDPKEYNDMAYGDFDLDGEINPGTVMTKVSLGFQDMVTVDAAVYEKGLGVNAYGNIADMADVSVYYMMDFAVTSWDKATEIATITDAKDFNILGANAAIMVMDGLKLGAGFEMASWDTSSVYESWTVYGVSAVYTMDALTATLGTNTDVYEDSDFGEETDVAIAVDYAVNEMISVNAAYKMPIDAGTADLADVMGYEVGVKAAVDGVTYKAGYALGSDNNAFDGGFMDGTDRAGNFYLKMSASF
ncbi:MAG: hypothetical protein B6241_13455 [Spirochaetaceae bacterium 4572_59]|nr:MAG: hypothetical protein B6241_13455 [Spirochaetaceae bacterium 4572_59]